MNKGWVFVMGVVVGLTLGYAWRMVQIEPEIAYRMERIERDRRVIADEIVRFDVRLGLLEGKGRPVVVKRGK